MEGEVVVVFDGVDGDGAGEEGLDCCLFVHDPLVPVSGFILQSGLDRSSPSSMPSPDRRMGTSAMLDGSMLSAVYSVPKGGGVSLYRSVEGIPSVLNFIIDSKRK